MEQRPDANTGFHYNDKHFSPLGHHTHNEPTPNFRQSYAEVASGGNHLENLIKKQMEQTDRLISMMSSIIELLQKQCAK